MIDLTVHIPDINVLTVFGFNEAIYNTQNLQGNMHKKIWMNNTNSFS